MRLRAKVAIGRARAGERQKMDLSDLPRPQLLAIFTKHANMAVARSPDGPALGQPLGDTHDSVAMSLGSTVDLHDILWPHTVVPTFTPTARSGDVSVQHAHQSRPTAKRPHG